MENKNPSILDIFLSMSDFYDSDKEYEKLVKEAAKQVWIDDPWNAYIRLRAQNYELPEKSA